MHGAAIPQINEKLKKFSEEKLIVLFDFISFLAERELHINKFDSTYKAIECMYASENVLARDWNLLRRMIGNYYE